MANEHVLAFINDGNTGTLIGRLNELNVVKYEADLKGSRRWTFADGTVLLQSAPGTTWADTPQAGVDSNPSDWAKPHPPYTGLKTSDVLNTEDWSR